MTIALSRPRLMRVLTGIFLFLNLAFLASQYAKLALGRGELWGMTRIFDMDAEASLPAWFESGLFALCAVLLWLIGRSPDVTSERWRGHWMFLSFIFIYLSLDEACSVHEMVNRPIRHALGIHSGPLYYAWVIPGALFCLTILLFCLKFLMSLPRRHSLAFLSAGTVFVFGAFVMEFVGADLKSSVGVSNPLYLLSSWFEESCEMSGLLMFVSSLLGWIEEYLGDVTIRVGRHRG